MVDMQNRNYKDPPVYPCDRIWNDHINEASDDCVLERSNFRVKPDRQLFDDSNVSKFLLNGDVLTNGRRCCMVTYETDGLESLQQISPQLHLDNIRKNEREELKKEIKEQKKERKEIKNRRQHRRK